MKHPIELFREWQAGAITRENLLRMALERGSWMCPADESYEWVDSETLEVPAFRLHQDPARGAMLLAFSHYDGRDAYEQAQGWEDADFTSQNLYDIFTILLDGVDAVCLDFGMEYEIVIPKEDFPKLKKLAEAVKVELAWKRLREGDEWEGDLRRVAFYEGYHVAVAKINDERYPFCEVPNDDGRTFIAIFTHEDARDLGWPEIQDRYEGYEPNMAAVSGPQVFPTFVTEDTSGLVVNPHGPTQPLVFTREVFELLSAEIDRADAVEPEASHDIGEDEPSEPATMQTGTTDFDKLSAAANGPNATMEDKNALFSETFRMMDWHFIARGQMPDVRPYIAANKTIVDGQPMLKAFTDTKRLHQFAKENELIDEDGSVDILSLPVSSILPVLDDYAAQGVWGIHFNANVESYGFYSPLVQMPIIRNHLVKHGLL